MIKIRNCTCLTPRFIPFRISGLIDMVARIGLNWPVESDMNNLSKGARSMVRKYIFRWTRKKVGRNRHIECDEDVTIVCAGEVGRVTEQGLDALGWEDKSERQGDYSEVVLGIVITLQTCTNQSVLRDQTIEQRSVAKQCGIA